MTSSYDGFTIESRRYANFFGVVKKPHSPGAATQHRHAPSAVTTRQACREFPSSLRVSDETHSNGARVNYDEFSRGRSRLIGSNSGGLTADGIRGAREQSGRNSEI